MRARVRNLDLQPAVILMDEGGAADFAQTLIYAATELKIPLAVCRSMDDLAPLKDIAVGAIVIDWDMGAGKGLTLAKLIARQFAGTPIILIADTDDASALRHVWPKSVKAFMPKALGFRAILDAAMTAHQTALSDQTTLSE